MATSYRKLKLQEGSQAVIWDANARPRYMIGPLEYLLKDDEVVFNIDGPGEIEEGVERSQGEPCPSCSSRLLDSHYGHCTEQPLCCRVTFSGQLCTKINAHEGECENKFKDMVGADVAHDFLTSGVS